MALSSPSYGLEKLYQYPFFSNQQQYMEAISLGAKFEGDLTLPPLPVFDYKSPVKRWIDLKALTSPRRMVVYDQALDVDARGKPIPGPNGQPRLQSPYVLDKFVAGAVNIPPNAAFPDSQQGAGEWPCPVRALDKDEELFFPFPGVVAVKNIPLWNEIVVENAGFNASDRAMLKRLSEAVGVTSFTEDDRRLLSRISSELVGFTANDRALLKAIAGLLKIADNAIADLAPPPGDYPPVEFDQDGNIKGSKGDHSANAKLKDWFRRAG